MKAKGLICGFHSFLVHDYRLQYSGPLSRSFNTVLLKNLCQYTVHQSPLRDTFANRKSVSPSFTKRLWILSSVLLKLHFINKLKQRKMIK